MSLIERVNWSGLDLQVTHQQRNRSAHSPVISLFRWWAIPITVTFSANVPCHPFYPINASMCRYVHHGEDHVINGARAEALGGEPRQLLRQGGEGRRRNETPDYIP